MCDARKNWTNRFDGGNRGASGGEPSVLALRHTGSGFSGQGAGGYDSISARPAIRPTTQQPTQLYMVFTKKNRWLAFGGCLADGLTVQASAKRNNTNGLIIRTLLSLCNKLNLFDIDQFGNPE